MPRTSTPITAAGALVRGALDSPPVGVSNHLELQLTVKASDLIALLTAAEQKALASPNSANQRLLFAVALTDDAGVLLNDGDVPAYLEAAVMGRTPIAYSQAVALARLLGYAN